VNGYDSINITKLDCLTGLKEIKICISYRNADMSEVRLPRGYFPAQLRDLEKIVPEYETLEGWTEDISRCKTFKAMPVNAQKYCLRIQELLGIPVSWIGVGQDRLDMLKVDIQNYKI